MKSSDATVSDEFRHRDEHSTQDARREDQAKWHEDQESAEDESAEGHSGQVVLHRLLVQLGLCLRVRVDEGGFAGWYVHRGAGLFRLVAAVVVKQRCQREQQRSRC